MKSQISQAIDAYSAKEISLISLDHIATALRKAGCLITDMDDMKQRDPATILHEVLSR
jgi:hypothetical protein